MEPLHVPLSVRRAAPAGSIAEPVGCSVPFPRGALPRTLQLRLLTPEATPVPAQFRVLEEWPDGSVRWIRVAWLRSASDPTRYEVRLANGEPPPFDHRLQIKRDGAEVSITANGQALRFAPGDRFPCADWDSWIETIDHSRLRLRARIHGVEILDSGPLEAVVLLRGTFETHAAVQFCATVSVFAGTPALRISLAVDNPHAAVHPSGIWELGDPGSILFRRLSWIGPPLPGATEARWSPSPDHPFQTGSLPVAFRQLSSGGPHTDSLVHVNSDRTVTDIPTTGHIDAPGGRIDIARLKPTLSIYGEECYGGIAFERFWEEFPKAVEADENRLIYHLWPESEAPPHELQPGERKRHDWVYAYDRKSCSPEQLAWARAPSLVAPDPDWYRRADAWPDLVPMKDDPADERTRFLQAAIEGEHSFFAKRESIDEYGWRHFGELWADHEAARSENPAAFVSHYNNQYDALEGLLVRFLATGDPRWWQLGDDLARHVRDIDRYQTSEDKASYNGGLFWHTAHYTPAGRATHRTYPRAPGIAGGGPSNEHNFTSGLLLHYLLTGMSDSRTAVLGLADWVIAMDDGRLAPLAFLDRGPTGLASQTVSPDFHGPGRGAGNSINALLDAHRLSGRAAYLTKADELVRRCIHPEEDPGQHDLLNRESRWSYTVFLFKLSRYLRHREIRDLKGAEYEYARASLLRYAEWMAENEFPYLDRPEDLEFPTETWAAQELRKCDVFNSAAAYSSVASAEIFRAAADRSYAATFEQLERFDTKFCTRPLVLILTCGMTQASRTDSHANAASESAPPPCFPPPMRFVGRRARIRRKAILAATLGFAVLVLAAVAWLT